MKNSFLLHDRINVIADQIGFDGFLNLLSTVKDCGIDTVGINQHDEGGFWEEKYISRMQMALQHCRTLGLKVIYFVDDISKAPHEHAAGWYVEPNSHRPVVKPAREQSTETGQLEFTFYLKRAGLYLLEYEASEIVESFLFKADHSPEWQLTRLSTNKQGFVEFPAIVTGKYKLVLRGPKNFTAKIEHLQTIDPWGANGRVLRNTEKPEVFEYYGRKDLSGRFFARTPDFSKRAVRLSVLQQAYTNLIKHYGGYFDVIDGVFIGGDEFSGCGEMFTWKEMLEDIKRHEAAASALGFKLYQWVRPGDYRHPAGANRDGSLASALTDMRFGLDNHIPIGWAEETSEDACFDTRKSLHPRAVAGLYLDRGQPEHFKNAGFQSFSGFWWPKKPQTWADFPAASLRHAVAVFEG